MIYGSMDAVADKMKAGTEEEIPYDNTDQDDDVVSGKRKPIQTERGAEYQRGMLKAQYKSRKASVVKQINVIKGLFQEPDSKPTIASIRELEQKRKKRKKFSDNKKPRGSQTRSHSSGKTRHSC